MYNKRTWLNNSISDSTGSIVAFDGEVKDLDTGNKYPQRFLEIADCRHKIRLHLTSDDSSEDFLNKMKLLRNEIEEFIIYLENIK
jgi:hypothetical protein